MAVPVLLTSPLPDPGAARQTLELPEGLSIAQIVEIALPGAPASAIRVLLVTTKGAAPVAPEIWHCVRPKPTTHVVLRLVPTGDNMGQVLTIVVAIAAMALGQFWAGQLIGKMGLAAGSLGAKALTVGLVTGLSVVGGLLASALIPAPDEPESETSYQLSGLRNTLRQNGRVPMVLGEIRYAPPFAARSYTEIVGDEQYIRAAFLFGYGRLRIEDIRIGDTSIEDYDDVTMEVREGVDTDLPLSLYPRQVLEDAVSTELVRPYPRDDNGDPIYSGDPEETPVIRRTAPDTASASAIIQFPGGLFAIDNKGRDVTLTVEVRIRQRLVGAVSWSEVTTLTVRASKKAAFFRQYTWELPTRGQYEIEVTRMTAESRASGWQTTSIWAALQSLRPEYPIAIDKPMALLSVRIRATYQLNGQLDDLNAMVTRYAPTWDGEAWTDAPTSNPASAYLYALQGPANAFPVADASVDLDQVADFYAFCAAKGMEYNAIHEQDETLGTALSKISSAGRASPHHSGIRWGVVIDRPTDLVVDHLSPRNSREFSWSRTYFDPPDAFRVAFLDETREYEEAERIVPWPGHTGAIELTEDLILNGKTSPDEVWIEARRRMYELIHRPDTIQATQDGAIRVASRGDQVMGSYDQLDRTQVAARVKSVGGDYIVLDEVLVTDEGVDYAIRFRAFDDDEDATGHSVVRSVTVPLSGGAGLLLSGTGEVPEVDALVHFGPLASESLALRVKGIEPGQDFTHIVHMVAAAPIIDELTDAEVPPEWDGRVGSAATIEELTPAVPLFSKISSGTTETGDADGVLVMLAPGTGTAAILSGYEVDHRLAGDTLWTTVSTDAASASVSIGDYVSGDDIEMQARAIAVGDVVGADTAIVSITVGSNDDPIPAALDAGSITVTGSLGHAVVTVAVSASDAPAEIQLYRVPSGDTLNTALHAAGNPFAVSAGATVQHIDGDGTRENILLNGDFGDSSAWTAGTDWALVTGNALHASGSAGDLTQAIAFDAGTTYRVGYVLASYVAGSVTPMLLGGSDRSGVATSADGLHTDAIQAVTGNITLAFRADSSFDAAISDITLFAQTTASVDAGEYDYYLAPLNGDAVPGPVSGPLTVQIR
ncbi:TipJ family phage tail tip protein [Antarcticimicrobium sediminis]|uniref:Phage tail protein n=1 Tax=Antarcticimicrobium sediminis TaxID=2546227 RepID=A0A4R5F185_9RHOB|nr:phage tail protein [Antarcticimicrobium sediminis]TDE40920.1 phage tail protein [Antarcticimicrobium sediminis]